MIVCDNPVTERYLEVSHYCIDWLIEHLCAYRSYITRCAPSLAATATVSLLPTAASTVTTRASRDGSLRCMARALDLALIFTRARSRSRLLFGLPPRRCKIAAMNRRTSCYTHDHCLLRSLGHRYSPESNRLFCASPAARTESRGKGRQVFKECGING
jgi:hypothetical protein